MWMQHERSKSHIELQVEDFSLSARIVRQRTLSYGKLPATEGRGTYGRIPFPTALAGQEAGLAVLAGTQPRHRAGLDWQRRPPGDAPSVARALALSVIPGTPAQLDSSRQFSLLVEDSADRGSIGGRSAGI